MGTTAGRGGVVPLKQRDVRRVLRHAAALTILAAILFVAGVGWSLLDDSSSAQRVETTQREEHGVKDGGEGEEEGEGRDAEEEEEEEEHQHQHHPPSPPSPPSPPFAPPPPPPPPPPRYGTCGDAPQNMQPTNVRKFDYCPTATGAGKRYAPAALTREAAAARPTAMKPWQAALVAQTRKKYAWMEKRDGGLEMIEKEEVALVRKSLALHPTFVRMSKHGSMDDSQYTSCPCCNQADTPGSERQPYALADTVGPGFQTLQKYHLQRAGGRGCGPRGSHVIENENYSSDNPVTSTAGSGSGWRNDPAKAALRACLLDLSTCNANATAAARALPSVAALIDACRAGFRAPVTQAPFPSPAGTGVRAARLAMRRAAEGGGSGGGGAGAKLEASVLYSGRKVGNVKDFLPPAIDGPKAKFRSCAIVGNAGHLTSHRWGKYIDRHEVVVRFNRQSVAGFTQHVGSRTTARFLNHNDGLGACCRGGGGCTS
jgi:hypothetical protein